jgi:hypothetical protein
MLNEEHESKHMVAALKFFVRYHQEGDNFFNQIVTGDETWISHIAPESKHHSVVTSFSFTVKTHKIQTDVINLESASCSFFWGGTGKSSFCWNSCPKGNPSMLPLAHVRYLLTLPRTFFSILPIVRTWLEVIFTCSHT